MTKLWIDDDFVDRAAPSGWMHVASVSEAVTVLRTGEVTQLSIDNDLNDPMPTTYVDAVDGAFLKERSSLSAANPGAGQGKMIIQWLDEMFGADNLDVWPERIVIHSGNACARDQMRAGIRAGAARAGYRVAESFTPGGKPEFVLA